MSQVSGVKKPAMCIGYVGIHVLNLLYVQQRAALSRISVVIGDIDGANPQDAFRVPLTLLHCSRKIFEPAEIVMVFSDPLGGVPLTPVVCKSQPDGGQM